MRSDTKKQGGNSEYGGTKTGVAAAVSAAVLFGLSVPIAKWLLGRVEPLPLAGLLYLGSGLGLAVVALVRRELSSGKWPSEASLTREDLPWLGATVAAGGMAGPILMMWGLSLTPGSIGSLLLNSEVILTALLAGLLFHEAVGGMTWAALVFMTGGGVLLSWMPGIGLTLPLGSLLVVAACAMWGLDTNITRHLSGKDPLILAMVKGLTAGSVTLILAWLTKSAWPSGGVVPGVMVMGALCYGMSLVLFIHALRHLGAARAGIVFGVAPFIGAACAVAFWGEPVTLTLIGAALLMGLGTWLVFKEEHNHEHTHDELHHEHRHIHDEHHRHHHPAGEADRPHSHPHVHSHVIHAHPHMPDLHHRHGHGPGL